MGFILRMRKLFTAYNAAIEGAIPPQPGLPYPGMGAIGGAFSRGDGRGFDSSHRRLKPPAQAFMQCLLADVAEPGPRPDAWDLPAAVRPPAGDSRR